MGITASGIWRRLWKRKNNFKSLIFSLAGVLEKYIVPEETNAADAVKETNR
jgi:hypothetical protein